MTTPPAPGPNGTSPDWDADPPTAPFSNGSYTGQPALASTALASTAPASRIPAPGARGGAAAGPAASGWSGCTPTS